MSDSRTKAAIPSNSNFNPAHQLPGNRSFVLQPRAHETNASPRAEQSQKLDAGVVDALGIQAQLEIGAPDDPYEREADAVASQVVEQINSPQAQQKAIQRQEVPEEEDELMMKPLDSLQQMEMEEEDLMMKPAIQRQADGQTTAASVDLESSIEKARGQGHSLDNSVRGSMEQAFGADFSGVRVHTDTQSDQLNHAIQARAFTTGQDVFFRQGEYQPDNSSGQELLAHELTHVVQQTGGGIQSKAIEPGPVDFPIYGKFVNPIQMQAEEKEEGNQPAQAKRPSSASPTEQRTSDEGVPTKLPEDVQKKMEASFQANFSEVNVYPESQSAKDVGALAYTQGENVHFSPSQFKPDTSSGQELIGHELAHVVQQRQGRVQPTSEVAGMPLNDNNGLESEADSLGKKAAQSSLPNNQKTVESTPSATGTLQKKGDVVQLAAPAALAALGAAEWVAIGTAGFAIAASETSAAASEDVSYTFDEMDGVLLPGGGTDVAKHKSDNPDAAKYEATHYVAVFVENNLGRVLGMKFGINFLFDSAGAIGNVSLSLEEVYDGAGYGGQVTVNLTSRSLGSGASVRITVNVGSNNSWFLPNTSGNVQFILRGGDGDLSLLRNNTNDYIQYEIG